MASRILLGRMFGTQNKVIWALEPIAYIVASPEHARALIAKGNIIEGIEAKE